MRTERSRSRHQKFNLLLTLRLGGGVCLAWMEGRRRRASDVSTRRRRFASCMSFLLFSVLSLCRSHLSLPPHTHPHTQTHTHTQTQWTLSLLDFVATYSCVPLGGVLVSFLLPHVSCCVMVLLSSLCAYSHQQTCDWPANCNGLRNGVPPFYAKTIFWVAVCCVLLLNVWTYFMFL